MASRAERREPSSPQEAQNSLSGERWQAVFTRIQDQLPAKLSIEELAATAGMSASCFTRLFKQRTGLTPCNYVIRQRIEKAKQLILEKRLDLSEIGAEVGFADQAHLTRHFKRLTGMTPAQFCKQRRARSAPS